MEKTERIGVYYVEGVGYCTGIAWAESQAASFGAPPPRLVGWETPEGEEIYPYPREWDESDPYFTPTGEEE